MIKIVLVLYAIAGIFKFIGTAISHLFRPKAKSQITTTSVSGSCMVSARSAAPKAVYIGLKEKDIAPCATPG